MLLDTPDGSGPAGAQASATNINVCNFWKKDPFWTLFWNPFWSPMTGAFTLDDKQQENKKWAAHVQSAVANRFGNGLICSEDVGPFKGRS